ncbi:hypothetical protein U9R62_04905 [Cylindrospermopsis raciborskii DSH]|uniref:hypothetical protein n=1 Tax=Cylindrospermopsis raciborskii TaxID=77022 RepID=UPI002EDAE8C8
MERPVQRPQNRERQNYYSGRKKAAYMQADYSQHKGETVIIRTKTRAGKSA